MINLDGVYVQLEKYALWEQVVIKRLIRLSTKWQNAMLLNREKEKKGNKNVEKK